MSYIYHFNRRKLTSHHYQSDKSREQHASYGLDDELRELNIAPFSQDHLHSKLILHIEQCTSILIRCQNTNQHLQCITANNTKYKEPTVVQDVQPKSPFFLNHSTSQDPDLTAPTVSLAGKVNFKDRI